MASSTTKPIASTNPTRVKTSIEKQAKYIIKNAERIETGIAITGIIVERQSRRNKKMIKTTNPNAMNKVSSTSLMDSLTGFVKSNPTINLKSDDISFFNCSSRL